MGTRELARVDDRMNMGKFAKKKTSVCNRMEIGTGHHTAHRAHYLDEYTVR